MQIASSNSCATQCLRKFHVSMHKFVFLNVLNEVNEAFCIEIPGVKSQGDLINHFLLECPPSDFSKTITVKEESWRRPGGS